MSFRLVNVRHRSESATVAFAHHQTWCRVLMAKVTPWTVPLRWEIRVMRRLLILTAVLALTASAVLRLLPLVPKGSGRAVRADALRPGVRGAVRAQHRGGPRRPDATRSRGVCCAGRAGHLSRRVPPA